MEVIMQIDKEKGLKVSKVIEATDNRLTAKMLSPALQGSYKERMEEEKTIILKYTPGKRPDVFFTGFWNGTFIKAAMGSISRAYRLRRRDTTRPIRVEPVLPPVREKKGGSDVK